MWVDPRVKLHVEAGLRHRFTCHIEQRAKKEQVSSQREFPHAGDTSSARAAREPELHGFGLIVAGVSKQYGERTGLPGRAVKRGIPRLPRICLRPGT